MRIGLRRARLLRPATRGRRGQGAARHALEGPQQQPHHLASMLIANTITGAAALFRRELLDVALPFPDTPGFQFHDHWLGVAALAAGDVELEAGRVGEGQGHCAGTDVAGRVVVWSAAPPGAPAGGLGLARRESGSGGSRSQGVRAHSTEPGRRAMSAATTASICSKCSGLEQSSLTRPRSGSGRAARPSRGTKVAVQEAARSPQGSEHAPRRRDQARLRHARHLDARFTPDVAQSRCAAAAASRHQPGRGAVPSTGAGAFQRGGREPFDKSVRPVRQARARCPARFDREKPHAAWARKK